MVVVRLILGMARKLRQHSAGASGMDKSDPHVVCAAAGDIVNQRNAACPELRESCVEIVDGVSKEAPSTFS